jgi:hypothetical protein
MIILEQQIDTVIHVLYVIIKQYDGNNHTDGLNNIVLSMLNSEYYLL